MMYMTMVFEQFILLDSTAELGKKSRREELRSMERLSVAIRKR